MTYDRLTVTWILLTIQREIDIGQTSLKPYKMTFTKLLPDDRHKQVLVHVINNTSCYEKPSPLMEVLVNNAGAEDLLDFYRLVEMRPEDVDPLEVTTSEGQVPLAGGYKAFIRNFQGMYSVCEKQIDWSDGLFLTLRWEDY
jgi:hypothetical protein